MRIFAISLGMFLLSASCGETFEGKESQARTQRESTASRKTLAELEANGFRKAGGIDIRAGGSCEDDGRCVSWTDKGYYLNNEKSPRQEWFCSVPNGVDDVGDAKADSSGWECEMLHG